MNVNRKEGAGIIIAGGAPTAVSITTTDNTIDGLSTHNYGDNTNVQDQENYSYITDEHRHLQYNDCSMCINRPKVTETGIAFKALINDCINNNNGCREELNYLSTSTPIGCWDVSTVINMELAFQNIYYFNSPLKCWNTGSVTAMDGMFGKAKK